MSTVHPEFNRETSRCKNCAAFLEWDKETKADFGTDGECRRRSPFPVQIALDFESDEHVWWPEVQTDQEWCCEWLPARAAPSPVSEWDVLAGHCGGVRARNACWRAKEAGLSLDAVVRDRWGPMRIMQGVGQTTMDDLLQAYGEMRAKA